MTIDDIVEALKALMAAGADRQELLTAVVMKGLGFGGVGISATGTPIAADQTRVGLTLNARPLVEPRPALRLTKADKTDMETMRKAHLSGRLDPADEPVYLRLLNRSIEEHTARKGRAA